MKISGQCKVQALPEDWRVDMPVPYGTSKGKGKMKYLTYEMIHPHAFISPPNSAGSAGGTVLFFGTIRCDRTSQQRVTHLVYEAYESLADRMIDDLISKTLRVWPVLGAKVLHRLGRVGMGETAVAIEVRSAHRDEAYQASRFLIDQIKEAVPIW